MKTSFLRNAAFAFLVGGAGLAAATALVYPQMAEAAGIRPQVGNPLKEAVSLASSGNGSAALGKVREAESVGGLSAAEQQAISKTKEYIAAKTGQGGGSAACRAKFANDYSAGRYRDVISDADCLHKSGNFGSNDQQVVAQAYYLMGDYSAAIREGRAAGPGARELVLSAAYKSGDTETQRSILEQLVREGKTQFWTNLLTAADNTRGLKDHQTLDLMRLRFATGNMKDKSDYMLAAELALQVGSAQEAANIVQKGLDAKVLSDDRATRLLALAKAQAAKDQASFAATQKAADASKSGDADLKLGEEYWGFGKYPEALSAIQNGISKGVTDPASAQMRLGQALMSSGKRDAAVSAFAKIKNDPNWQMIARLWTLYASTGH